MILPPFSLLAKQPKIPNNARNVARCSIPNEHGTPITFRVWRERSGRAWYAEASLQGMRMSNTVRTTSERIAMTWIRAVETSQISVGADL